MYIGFLLTMKFRINFRLCAFKNMQCIETFYNYTKRHQRKLSDQTGLGGGGLIKLNGLISKPLR